MPKLYYTQTEHKIANILSIVSIILCIAIIALSIYGAINRALNPPPHNYYYSPLHSADDVNGNFDLAPGEIIKFGRYEQDNNVKNGPEDIKWIVLKIQDNKALVTSKYALDYVDYGQQRWYNSYIRSWLNEEFMSSAFYDDEKAIIAPTSIYTEYPNYSQESKDKIFLLSIDEINEYFSDERPIHCEATKYAQYKGVATAAESKTPLCNLWLRTKNDNDSRVLISESNIGYSDSKNAGVRPAMWIYF